MNPLQCKINRDHHYFYCVVVIGHMLPDNDWARDWDSPGEYIASYLSQCAGCGIAHGKWNKSAVAGIWHFPDDRSISHALVEMAKDPFVMVKLPKSGMEIRKQIRRPDLLQSFGPHDRGIYRTQVGSHIIDFIVGWPTPQAAESDHYYPIALEVYARMARGIEGRSAVPVRTMYCAPPHRVARPEQVEGLYEAFISQPWNGPALVGYWEGDFVQLLSGSHRWKAAQVAQIPHLPVVLYSKQVIQEAWGDDEKWAKIINSGADFTGFAKTLDFPL